MEKIGQYITDIIKILKSNAESVENYNDAGQYDINKWAEEYYRGLLNLFFDWNLINANRAINANYSGVDLLDKDKKIAVQITSEKTSEKVKETIKGFLANSFKDGYKQLYIVMIKGKAFFPRVDFKELTENQFEFDKEKHIIDNSDLSKMLKDADFDYIEKIYNYLIKVSTKSYQSIATDDNDLDIIDEIFKYINSNISNLKYDIQNSVDFTIDLNKKISLNFSNRQENDIKEKITNLMSKKNLVDQYMKDNDDTQLQLDLKDFIQTNYRKVRDTSNIDEAIKEVIFIDKLADSLLPEEKMTNPHYRANANAIVLYFFEMCDFGRKSEIENNNTEQLFD